MNLPKIKHALTGFGKVFFANSAQIPHSNLNLTVRSWCRPRVQSWANKKLLWRLVRLHSTDAHEIMNVYWKFVNTYFNAMYGQKRVRKYEYFIHEYEHIVLMNTKAICPKHTYIVIHEYEYNIRGYEYNILKMNTIFVDMKTFFIKLKYCSGT